MGSLLFAGIAWGGLALFFAYKFGVFVKAPIKGQTWAEKDSSKDPFEQTRKVRVLNVKNGHVEYINEKYLGKEYDLKDFSYSTTVRYMKMEYKLERR